jgi:hypothetical protein
MKDMLERDQTITLPEVDVTTQPAAVAPGMRARAAFIIAIVMGIGFVAGGSYTIARGFDARSEVRDALVAENIVTPEDASIPNAPVVDHATAHAQADVIWKHMLEATGGKTYAEMDRTDPLRQVAFTASALRTSLLSAALAWHTAELAMGVGLFIAVMGLLLLTGAYLFRPAKVGR